MFAKATVMTPKKVSDPFNYLKRCLTCSVEKLFHKLDYSDVVCQYKQHHFTALRPVASGSKCTAEVTFDHAENCFDLSTMAVSFPVKITPHQLAIFTFERFVS